MKAYKAYDDKNCEGYSTVVYAENATQAKLTALRTDACEDAEYIDIRVKRYPLMDALYKGSSEVDWCDPEQRIALVKEYGWECLEPEYEDCEDCPAREWCGAYERYKN